MTQLQKMCAGKFSTVLHYRKFRVPPPSTPLPPIFFPGRVYIIGKLPCFKRGSMWFVDFIYVPTWLQIHQHNSEMSLHSEFNHFLPPKSLIILLSKITLLLLITLPPLLNNPQTVYPPNENGIVTTNTIHH